MSKYFGSISMQMKRHPILTATLISPANHEEDGDGSALVCAFTHKPEHYAERLWRRMLKSRRIGVCNRVPRSKIDGHLDVAVKRNWRPMARPADLASAIARRAHPTGHLFRFWEWSDRRRAHSDRHAIEHCRKIDSKIRHFAILILAPNHAIGRISRNCIHGRARERGQDLPAIPQIRGHIFRQMLCPHRQDLVGLSRLWVKTG